MEAAIIRFHRANEIRFYKTVSYPTMLILPIFFFFFFCTLQKKFPDIKILHVYHAILHATLIILFLKYISVKYLCSIHGRATQKRFLGHMRTAKAQIGLSHWLCCRFEDPTGRLTIYLVMTIFFFNYFIRPFIYLFIYVFVRVFIHLFISFYFFIYLFILRTPKTTSLLTFPVSRENQFRDNFVTVELTFTTLWVDSSDDTLIYF